VGHIAHMVETRSAHIKVEWYMKVWSGFIWLRLENSEPSD